MVKAGRQLLAAANDLWGFANGTGPGGTSRSITTIPCGCPILLAGLIDDALYAALLHMFIIPYLRFYIMSLKYKGQRHAKYKNPYGAHAEKYYCQYLWHKIGG